MGNRGARMTAEEVAAGKDMGGKVCMVTGSTSGIGVETAAVLARHGCSVVLAGRSQEKLDMTAAFIRSRLGNPNEGELISTLCFDLADLNSVQRAAAEYASSGRPLHLLVCNGGVMACPFGRTADGFETQFGTNHMGHFALTVGLLPILRSSAPSRVIVVASAAHVWGGQLDFEDLHWERRPYTSFLHALQSYQQSKLANILFAKQLNHRESSLGSGVTAVSLHPGTINTDLLRHFPFPLPSLASMLSWLFMKSVPQGAATTVLCATAPTRGDGDVTGGDGCFYVPGGYYQDCGLSAPSAHAVEEEAGERLWRLSEELLQTPPRHLLETSALSTF